MKDDLGKRWKINRLFSRAQTKTKLLLEWWNFPFWFYRISLFHIRFLYKFVILLFLLKPTTMDEKAFVIQLYQFPTVSGTINPTDRLILWNTANFGDLLLYLVHSTMWKKAFWIVLTRWNGSFSTDFMFGIECHLEIFQQLLYKNLCLLSDCIKTSNSYNCLLSRNFWFCLSIEWSISCRFQH